MLVSICVTFTQVVKTGYRIANKIHLDGDGGLLSAKSKKAP